MGKAFFVLPICLFLAWSLQSHQAVAQGKHYKYEVDSSGFHFKKRADFIDTEFYSQATFIAAEFYSQANFVDAEFYSSANFSYAHFESFAGFHYTEFYSSAKFRSAEFESRASFSDAEFKSGADFWDAKFKSGADFWDAKFDSLANFSLAEFDSLADLSGAKFGSRADFSHSKINIMDLSNILLPEKLSFQDATVTKEVILKPNYLDSLKTYQCEIDFRGTDLQKFDFYYNENYVLFRPDSVTLSNYEELTNVYEGLLKNFKDRGYLTSYERVDKEYRVFKYIEDPRRSFMGIITNWINWAWNDYGYDKARILTYSLGFFLFFWCINAIFLPTLVHKVYPISKIKDRLDSFGQADGGVSTIKRSLESLILAMFYTGLIFFGLKMDMEKMEFKKKRWTTYLFFQYTLGLVCLAYLANYVITSGLL